MCWLQDVSQSVIFHVGNPEITTNPWCSLIQLCIFLIFHNFAWLEATCVSRKLFNRYLAPPSGISRPVPFFISSPFERFSHLIVSHPSLHLSASFFHCNLCPQLRFPGHWLNRFLCVLPKRYKDRFVCRRTGVWGCGGAVGVGGEGR